MDVQGSQSVFETAPPDKAMPALGSASLPCIRGRRGAAPRWSTVLREADAVDRAIYEAVARTPTPLVDRHLRRLSEAATYSRLWFAIAGAVALFAGQRGRRAARDGVVAIAVTSASVNLVAKSIAVRQRPDAEAFRRVASREARMPKSWSFPSGHAASASAFSYAVSRHLPGLAVPLALLAGAVSYSRVHIGVHYPADVVVGAAFGSGIAAMVASVSDRRAARRRHGRKARRRVGRAKGSSR